MAKTEGVTLYECDRCGAKEYIKPGSSGGHFWHTIARVDAEGVQTSRLLCEACYQDYTGLIKQQDEEFQAFMRGGKK